MRKKVIRKNLFLASIFTFLYLLYGSMPVYSNVKGDRLYKWRKDILDTLNDTEKKRLIEKADEELKNRNIVVTNKKQCLTGDKHNYESLSSYYWPDPNNPNGAYISKDGLVNPETLDYDREKIDKMATRCVYFSKAYYFTKDKKYYRAFVDQIDDWFVGKRTKMNPHMNYSQVIKGKYNNKGQAHGIIDAYALSNVLESIRLVEIVKPLPKRQTSALKMWFFDFSEWLQNSEQGKIESKQPNNHCPYYYSLLANIGIYTGNEKLIENIINRYPEIVLRRLILEDGRQPGEMVRTRAYHYSILSLSAMVDFCYIMKQYGVDFYGENEEIINKGFAYLTQYIDNRDAFPAQEIGNWDYEVSYLRKQIDRLESLKSSK